MAWFVAGVAQADGGSEAPPLYFSPRMCSAASAAFVSLKNRPLVANTAGGSLELPVQSYKLLLRCSENHLDRARMVDDLLLLYAAFSIHAHIQVVSTSQKK